MDYIILDLEWNQGNTKTEPYEVPPFEIIEIAAVKMSPEYEILGDFSELIRPQLYPSLHYMTQKITHIRLEELKGSKGIADVMRDFFDWCGTDYIFCTWGDRDLTELQRNLNYFHVENPFRGPLFYYDLQKLYSLYHYGKKAQVKLETAVEEQQISQKLPFHRAGNDTYYTALVMTTIDMKQMQAYYSIDCYRIPEGNGQLSLTFPGYHKYVSHGFDSREQLIGNASVTNMECPVCGRRIRRKIHWFAAAKNYHLCVAYCQEHGYMKGKLRVRKTDMGSYYGIKTVKPIKEDTVEEIRERKRLVRERRRLQQEKES